LAEKIRICYIFQAMDDLQPMNRAATAAGVDRNTVARWVKTGLLKSKKGRYRHLETTLVSVAKVKMLAADRKPGRPKGSGKTIGKKSAG
jgi:ribosomal protein L19E